VTGRTGIVAFTNAFHGMTLGALSVTGSGYHRRAAGVPLEYTVPMPFNQPLAWLERVLTDPGSGVSKPAAVIVETVQGEGGINVASPEWLRGLASLCQRHDMLLIVDDVQMGCGRTGPFFSFEQAGIVPDLVCLSKSISGYGLPMALTLIRAELDIWEPGEHNGTFRGFNPAMVTATAALRTYWADDSLERHTILKGHQVEETLTAISDSVPGTPPTVRGRGLAYGLQFENGDLAGKVATAAFERGLLVETAGPHGEVVKLMPPLIIDESELDQGLSLLADAVRSVC
jgi:diaminobutyrate-2-oxoglutarate transaminase